eukprot:scaffold34652_cov211-Amphora_coffeaeformis.AAC.4
MPRGRIPKVASEKRHHGLQDLRRDGRCTIVIQINTLGITDTDTIVILVQLQIIQKAKRRSIASSSSFLHPPNE